jgi:hypothetical protein
MPSFSEIEREYRALSTRISYAAFNDETITVKDQERYEMLSRALIEMSAPDFSDAKAVLEAA